MDETLGVLLKYQDDIAKMKGAEAARLLIELQDAGMAIAAVTAAAPTAGDGYLANNVF